MNTLRTVVIAFTVASTVFGELNIIFSGHINEGSTDFAIACSISNFTNAAQWLNNGTSKTKCNNKNVCTTTSDEHYNYSSDANGIYIKVKSSLPKTANGDKWTCTHDGFTSVTKFVKFSVTVSNPSNNNNKLLHFLWLLLIAAWIVIGIFLYCCTDHKRDGKCDNILMFLRVVTLGLIWYTIRRNSLRKKKEKENNDTNRKQSEVHEKANVDTGNKNPQKTQPNDNEAIRTKCSDKKEAQTEIKKQSEVHEKANVETGNKNPQKTQPNDNEAIRTKCSDKKEAQTEIKKQSEVHEKANVETGSKKPHKTQPNDNEAIKTKCSDKKDAQTEIKKQSNVHENVKIETENKNQHKTKPNDNKATETKLSDKMDEQTEIKEQSEVHEKENVETGNKNPQKKQANDNEAFKTKWSDKRDAQTEIKKCSKDDNGDTKQQQQRLKLGHPPASEPIRISSG